MSETQEIRTEVVWSTAGVDRGLQRVERAVDRLDKAEEKAVKMAQARQAQEANRERQNRERALRDLERIEKESNDRRAKATNEMYSKMQREERNRVSQVVQQLKINQIREGISPSGTAAQRVGAGGGGHSGHGGLLGGNSRLIGDALDGITGHSGWVMRLKGLEMAGSALGRLIGPVGGAAAVGYLGAKGYAANSRLVEATDEAKRGMGERVDNPWLKTPVVGAGLQMLPHWMQPDPFTVPKRDAQSQEGRTAQREEILGQQKALQDARGGFGGFARDFLKSTLNIAGTFVRPIRKFSDKIGENEDNSFRTEERQQDKLNTIDATSGAFLDKRTAAQRVARRGSQFTSRDIQTGLDLEEKLAGLQDQKNQGKIGISEYVAAQAKARQDASDATFQNSRDKRTFERDSLRGEGLNKIKAQGVDVDARSAAVELSAAMDRLAAAKQSGTPEEARTAGIDVGEKTEAHRRAVQTTAERNANFGVDSGIANLRGNVDSNREREASAEVMRAKQLAELAHTDVEQKTAALELARALRAQEELRMQVESRRVGFAQANFARQQQTAAARMGLAEGSTAGTLAQASAGVATAREGVFNARRNQAIQKNSEQSVQATKQAEADLRDAVLAQAATRLQIKRTREDELKVAKGDVDATRLANAGYGQQAALIRSQLANHQAIVAALRDGKTELAAQLQKMGELEVKAARYARFFNADGTRRRRGDITREDNAARRGANAKARFDRRSANNFGMRNVHRAANGAIIDGQDELHPEDRRRYTPRQLEEKYARDTRREEAQVKKEQEGALSGADKMLDNIWKELKDRLPPKPAGK